MNDTRKLRRKKLIKPDMQLGLILSFGGVAFLAMLVQFLLLGFLLIDSFSRIEGLGGELADEVPGVLLTAFGASILVLVPLFLTVGITLTFRYAGPIYRFEQYLKAIGRGEDVGPCKIRKGDRLQPLCDAINFATARIQKNDLEGEPDDASESERAA